MAMTPYRIVAEKVKEIKRTLNQFVAALDRDINEGSGLCLLNDLDEILRKAQWLRDIE
jgi:hypothetical protein